MKQIKFKKYLADFIKWIDRPLDEPEERRALNYIDAKWEVKTSKPHKCCGGKCKNKKSNV
jgi:hypothetical protein